MSNTAAHLMDHVIAPDVTLRQWVLTVSIAGRRWISARAGYLLPVAVLGALFRGKLLRALGAAHAAGKLRLPDEHEPVDPEASLGSAPRGNASAGTSTVKPPFGGPEQVLRYLGRYTHRVGISNRRLVSLDERGVTFRTKDGKIASTASSTTCCP